MYSGHWLEGADRTKDVVLDTNGMFFEVVGEAEDGTLELIVATDERGYPVSGPLFDPERAADVESDIDLAMEYDKAHAGVAYIGDSFPPVGLGSVPLRRAVARDE